MQDLSNPCTILEARLSVWKFSAMNRFKLLNPRAGGNTPRKLEDFGHFKSPIFGQLGHGIPSIHSPVISYRGLAAYVGYLCVSLNPMVVGIG